MTVCASTLTRGSDFFCESVVRRPYNWDVMVVKQLKEGCNDEEEGGIRGSLNTRRSRFSKKTNHARAPCIILTFV